MKILDTKTRRKIISLIFIFAFMFNTLVVYGNNRNPSRENLEDMIDDVAVKRAIPSVLLKSIARVESVYSQFNSDGSPKVNGSSIGLMQVNNRYGGYDSEKLKYDISYNIEAGADVLLNKWSTSSYNSVSSVGNMDPNVLENWYFALWAYNGWSSGNNPNTYGRGHTYQQLIYDTAENEYGEKINDIDFSYLPKSGKPGRSLTVPTPAYTNSANIVLYEKGDYVMTDGIREKCHLRDCPAGKYVYDINVMQLGTITDGPVLQKGYYWYKVCMNDNAEGWIERNWLTRTGDKEHGNYVFDDISFNWARKIIMDLYSEGVVAQALSFNPDCAATKEEFLTFLGRVLENNEVNVSGTNDEENVLPFVDVAEIHPWAVKYVQLVKKLGLLEDYGDELNPLSSLSRKEAAKITENLFEENEKNKETNDFDICTIFSDLTQLSQEEKDAVKSAYTNGIMSAKEPGNFCPYDCLTRAEAVALASKINNKLKE